MVTREEFVASLRARLDRWDAKLAELEAKEEAKEAREKQRRAERVEALKRRRDEAAEKLAEIQGATGDAWERLKEGAETMWDDFTQTLAETQGAFLEGLRDDESNRS